MSNDMGIIYKITNKLNNKIYIGKTDISVSYRWSQHCKDSYRFPDRPLYRAINKYGADCFDIEIIEETENTSSREIYWIEFYNSYKAGYNATKGGEGSTTVDENNILLLHENGNSAREISEIANCDYSTVIKILDKNKLEPNKHKIRVKNKVKVLNVTTGIVYESQHEAARALNPFLEKDKLSSLANKISLCCRGVRKSVLKNTYKYIDPN